MNILKKIHTIQFNCDVSRYNRRLERTKRAALKQGRWTAENMQGNLTLWDEEKHRLVYKLWMDEPDSRLSLSDLSPAALAQTSRNAIKSVQTKLRYDQRKKYWNNVFWFIHPTQTPTLAGMEYYLHSPEPEEGDDWVGIASFSYPSEPFENRHGMKREFARGDYELYEHHTEDIRERVGKNLVYVEPVGHIDEDGVEAAGTIGSLGFRIWLGDGDGVPLFHEDESNSHWNVILKHRALVVSPIQRLEGLLNTFLANTLITGSSDIDGVFNIITVASVTTTATEYMARADEIREAIGVPGLMVSHSRPSKEKPEGGIFPSNRTAKANEHGVHYTTFTFYSGNATEVINSDVDLDENGDPASVVSGFMPIHSVQSIPRKRKLRGKAVKVAQPS